MAAAEREKQGWQRSILVNGLGALTTCLVALVIAVAKFLEGAWIVILLIPLLVLLFLGIRRHYQCVERERATHLLIHPGDIRHRIIVPIAGLDHASEQSLAYARSLSLHVTAVHVAIDEQEAEAIRAAWHEWQQWVPEEEVCICMSSSRPIAPLSDRSWPISIRCTNDIPTRR